MTAIGAALAGLASEVAGRPAVVALSGGLDSCVLLHALRYGARTTVPLIAAHFDHGMRPDSSADAAWVRGLCRAWDVRLAEGAVDVHDEVPASEDEARRMRYAFLRRVSAEYGAVLLTAHHADDQAETVLFRVLRGTGIEGLAGIPRRRVLGGIDTPDVTLLRPLLEVTRAEVEAYAERNGVPCRPDPTNESSSYARNVIRNVILPVAEAQVAGGARRSLVRLAEIAGDEEAAWNSALPFVLSAVDARGVSSTASALGDPDPPGAGNPPVEEDVSCGRKSLLALGPALAARVLRVLAASAGVTLDRGTTRRALAFVRDSQSGRYIELGRGVELRLRDGRVIIVSSENPETDPTGRSASRDGSE